MASGLCGDTAGLHAQIARLQAAYPQSTRVAGYYTSDLNALMQIRSGGFADALVTLQSADHYDSVSFNAYLRGQAYLSQKKPQPATVELQALLRHPGQVALVSPEMLPSAELSLGRAFAANGDAGNTALAEARLATIR